MRLLTCIRLRRDRGLLWGQGWQTIISEVEMGLLLCQKFFSNNCCQRVSDLEKVLITINPLKPTEKTQTAWETYPGKAASISGSMILHFING